MPGTIGTDRAAVNEAFAGIGASAIAIVAVVALINTVGGPTSSFSHLSASGCCSGASVSSRA
jgi:hypothetical protein